MEQKEFRYFLRCNHSFDSAQEASLALERAKKRFPKLYGDIRVGYEKNPNYVKGPRKSLLKRFINSIFLIK